MLRCPECDGESASRNDEGQLVCDDCGTVINQGLEMTEVARLPNALLRCSRELPG
jgi:transcription initiation factor TFIIIB Brf1 subunit/transcription initiation factor TFIIB